MSRFSIRPMHAMIPEQHTKTYCFNLAYKSYSSIFGIHSVCVNKPFFQSVQRLRFRFLLTCSMSDFNTYMTRFDYSGIIDFIRQNGTLVKYRRGEPFSLTGSSCKTMGYIRKGAFIYSAHDSRGEHHVVGYAFENSFVGDYGAFRLKEISGVDIVALCESEVYLITYETLERLITENSSYFLHITELLYSEIYQRFVDTYTRTPEERYIKILQCNPHIFKRTTAKDLASYLQITPETLSRIRRKLKKSNKNLF